MAPMAIPAGNSGYWHRRLREIIISVIVCVALAMLLHYRGSLHGPDMWAFDALSKSLPAPADSGRVVVIGYDDADVRYFRDSNASDALLAKVINTVEAAGPRVTGLAFLREAHVPPGRDALIAAIASNSSLYGANSAYRKSTSKVGAVDTVRPGYTGIARHVVDSDGKVRWMLLGYADPQTGRPLPSFSLLVAAAYARASGREMHLNKQGELSIDDGRRYLPNGDAIGEPVDNDIANFAFLSSQIPRSSTRKISFREVLENPETLTLLRDKVVLIGLVAKTVGTRMESSWSRPGDSWHDVEFRAVEVERLLGVALDGRHLVQTLPVHLFWIWVAFWAGLAALVSWYPRHRRKRIFLLAGLLLAIIALTWLALEQGLWVVPLVPIAVIIAMIIREIVLFLKCELALSEATKLMRQLIDKIPEPVYVLDTNGRLRIVNEAFSRLADGLPHELLHLPFDTVFKPLNLVDPTPRGDKTRCIAVVTRLGSRYKLVTAEEMTKYGTTSGFMIGIIRSVERLESDRIEVSSSRPVDHFRQAQHWAKLRISTLQVWLIVVQRPSQDGDAAALFEWILRRISNALPDARAYWVEGDAIAILVDHPKADNLQRMHDALGWPFLFTTESARCQYLIAHASWPRDGDTLESLLASAAREIHDAQTTSLV